MLDDFSLFSEKMDTLYYLTALCFRIRAYWDKYMGVLFLLHEHERYDQYVSSKSRKKFFIKRASECPEVSVHLIECMTNIVRTICIHTGQNEVIEAIDRGEFRTSFPDQFLDLFDKIIEMADTFRTPEAHGTGRLRKFTLANVPMELSMNFSLATQWNDCNTFMQALQNVIKDLALEIQ
ncbi:MAG: hypothetical protein F4X97_06540 [Boseongicola sp. SB0662_bin_57]|nr:hypothetical protein [Boseongicola sp. SB0662_bin_57]